MMQTILATINNLVNHKTQIFLLFTLTFLCGCTSDPEPMTVQKTKTSFQVNTPSISSTEVFTDDFETNKPRIDEQKSPIETKKTDIPSLSKMEFSSDGYFLIETLGGDLFLKNIFGVEEYGITATGHFIQWDRSGCILYYSDFDKNIYAYTLGKKVPTIMLSREDLIKKTGSVFLQPRGISYDGSWVWYWKGEGALIPGYDMGDQFSRVEEQNVMIIKSDLTDKPISISNNGGGWTAAWSPVNTQIAYSDFDENHLLQVFTFDLDQNKITQLTKFNEKTSISAGWSGLNINNLIWSTNGKKLGINYEIITDKEFQKYFMVVDIETNDVLYDQSGVNGRWWINDEQFVQINTDKEINTIEVYDLLLKKLLTSIPENYFGKNAYVFSFMKNNWIGFLIYGSEDLYIYDIKSTSFSQVPFSLELDYAYKISTTNPNFQSLQLCQAK